MRYRHLFLRCVALSLVLSGALGTPIGSRAAAPTMTPAPATLHLSACTLPLGLSDVGGTVDAQCGTLVVPLDRANPNSGDPVALAVVELPALDPSAKGLPIFHLEGGPGASAITEFGQAWYSAYRLLRQKHPVVLIDQRGMGKSGALDCFTVAGPASIDMQSSQAYLDQLAACQSTIGTHTDTRFYTSDILADDTDAVRAALGYDQILLFGNSYGTDLAQFYLRRHGDHVAGAVLDSAVGPAQLFTLDAPLSGQAAFDSIIALCQADPVCAKDYPDLVGNLNKATAALKANPATITTLTGSTPITITDQDLLNTVFQVLYNSGNISSLPYLLRQAAAGNYQLVGSIIQEIESTTNISDGTYLSIVCAEQVAQYTPAVLTANSIPATNLFKDLSTPSELQAQCARWKYSKVPVSDFAPVTTNRPVLILSGALDPITPPHYAATLHATMAHSTVVSFPFQGHGVIVNSFCAQQITAAFMDAPTAPINSACTVNDLKPIFQGAYPLKFLSYTSPTSKLTVPAPIGWTVTEPADLKPLTVFTSPDKLLVSAVGLYKNRAASNVQDEVVAALTKHYGTLDAYEDHSTAAMGAHITVYFTTQNGQVDLGTLIVLQAGGNVAVFWHSAPIVWATATLDALTPQITGLTQTAMLD